GAERGKHPVRKRPGERDRTHSKRRPKARLVERHRLPVTESGKDYQEGAERVEVGHRIEAQPAHEARGVVAEARRRIRVHELVDGDAEEDRDDESDERDGVLRGPLDGSQEPAGEPPVEQQETTDEEERDDLSDSGSENSWGDL